MAQQGTEEKTGAAGGDGSGAEATGGEGAGRHAASEESTSTEQQAPAEQATETTAAEPKTEEKAPAEPATEKVAAPAEPKTEKIAPAEQPTKREEAPARGQKDTSWAEPERAETPRHRSVDIGELAWRTGNVLATVVRTLALLFALVLVVNVVLALLTVNPANGVAQFVSGVANIVILGFRDLFIPANPLIGLIVNSLIAAVFWVFVGELVSRVIRFLAARVK
ncbi:hypothetical protein LQ327_08045 [Actinomycetospora endophytica]|uniref:YGGT family protein n=1 Tax=Actinomycetospora endophytica TaxID=2291215 RepID=A0ABS8P506_9PSEU|nr:hypothetical protein [Actinomycetospora endophytica]MCD2193337.1 hypothetical protein [Actinomycetospora endophytica]